MIQLRLNATIDHSINLINSYFLLLKKEQNFSTPICTLGQKFIGILSQNSHTLKNLIFHKIHISKISFFFTKFTFSKFHFSQNSHFQSLIFHRIHIFPKSNSKEFLYFRFCPNAQKKLRLLLQLLLLLLHPDSQKISSTQKRVKLSPKRRL